MRSPGSGHAAGACLRAYLKRSRTPAAPTPTIISTNSVATIGVNRRAVDPAPAAVLHIVVAARRIRVRKA